MEKEQLNNLSLALDQIIAQISEGLILRTEATAKDRPAPGSMPVGFPRTPTYEFQVGQIKLNYDEQNALFQLGLLPLEILVENEEPRVLIREEDEVSFLFTQQQAQDLSGTIGTVVASGRPVCPLCHTPLDGGPHACIRQNGHYEIVQIEAGEEEDDQGI
jgi:uncharacterized repeat protein (TIGR03847 family)